jgi:hypothetical protein
LHFDVQQFPHIYWNDLYELQKTLGFRIERLVGRGPVQSDTG